MTCHDLYEEYPDFQIDVERERELMESHERIVWQHPFYWCSTPALMKEWFDVVLQYGWAYARNGTALHGKRVKSPMKSTDIRYTTRDGFLYAFVLDWPAKTGEALMEFLAPTNKHFGKIESVELLGHSGELKWEQGGDGLSVTFPKEKPCDFAYCLKIRLPKK